MEPMPSWWPKLERVIKNYLPNMIGSFASGAIAFIVAKNQTKTLSQLFKELQGSNSEFKLVTPNLFLGPYQDYFGTILGLF